MVPRQLKPEPGRPFSRPTPAHPRWISSGVCAACREGGVPSSWKAPPRALQLGFGASSFCSRIGRPSPRRRRALCLEEVQGQSLSGEETGRLPRTPGDVSSLSRSSALAVNWILKRAGASGSTTARLAGASCAGGGGAFCPTPSGRRDGPSARLWKNKDC